MVWGGKFQGIYLCHDLAARYMPEMLWICRGAIGIEIDVLEAETTDGKWFMSVLTWVSV